MKKFLLTILISFFLFSVFSGTACSIKELIGKDPKAFTKEDVSAGVMRFVDIMAAGASTFAVIFIVYGGILYITSAGNQEGMTKGKNTLTWAIIGFIIIICSWVIVNYVVKLTTSDNVVDAGSDESVEEPENSEELAFFEGGAEWTYCSAGAVAYEPNKKYTGLFENLFVSADEESVKTSCVNLSYPDKVKDYGNKTLVQCLNKTVDGIAFSGKKQVLKGEWFAEAGKTYNINPAFLIAIATKETDMGTAYQGTSLDSSRFIPGLGGWHNIGNIKKNKTQYIDYNSYQEGVNGLASYLSKYYSEGINNNDIRGIAYIYCPPTEDPAAPIDPKTDRPQKCNTELWIQDAVKQIKSISTNCTSAAITSQNNYNRYYYLKYFYPDVFKTLYPEDNFFNGNQPNINF